MALLNYAGERRTNRFDRLTSPIFGFAVAVVLLSVATHAFAQRDDGFYVSAAYMTTFTGAHDFEVGVKPAESADFVAKRSGTGSFDIGFLGFHAAAGYSIFGFRPEAEVSYRQLKVSGYEYELFTHGPIKLEGDSLEPLNKNLEVTSGNLKTLGLMANVWYDIDTGGALMPYVGGGAGVGQVTIDTEIKIKPFSVSPGIPFPGLTATYPASSAWAFAFQAGAGLGYKLGSGLSASLGYRIFGTTKVDVPWTEKDEDNNDILKASILQHNVDLGISYRF